MPEVITVGEILVEIMTKEVGQKFTKAGNLVGPYPSGAPAIFIDQVARMGVDCGMIARIGDDDFGRLNKDRLAKDGVDVSQIISTPGYTTGTAFVTYFDNGDREFIYHFTHSAAGQLCVGDIDESYFRDAKYLHIMGCSLSASKSMREAIWKAIEICKEKNIKISFDPNIRPELLNIAEIKRLFNRILTTSDIILSGESELNLLFDNKDIEDVISYLNKEGVTTIILKNGSRGTRIYSEEGNDFCPPVEVEEIDPTGAGDCFDGAFIASLINGKDVKKAARIANMAGALSVTRKGPMEGAAFREEILNFLNE